MRVRLAVVLACCAACGRVGFDSIAANRGGDAGSDAAIGDGAGADAGDARAPSIVYLISAGSSSGAPTDLLTVDLATAHVTLVGNVPESLGQLGGLAYWDSNTLYASGSGNIVQITLSPFSATEVATGGYTLSALERDGSDLIGLEQGTNVLVRFQPPYMNPLALGTSLNVDGGDIVKTAAGTWFYYSNATTTLYTFDPVTGSASAVGPSTPGGFVSALVRDASDQLFITVEGVNTLWPIDATTGALGADQVLCESCPAPYVLGAGDATTTP